MPSLKNTFNLPISAARRSLIGLGESDGGTKMSYILLALSSKDGVAGGEVADAAAFRPQPMPSKMGHGHVHHPSMAAGYSGIPLSSSLLTMGVINGRSAIALGRREGCPDVMLVLENRGGV